MFSHIAGIQRGSLFTLSLQHVRMWLPPLLNLGYFVKAVLNLWKYHSLQLVNSYFGHQCSHSPFCEA